MTFSEIEFTIVFNFCFRRRNGSHCWRWRRTVFSTIHTLTSKL